MKCSTCKKILTNDDNHILSRFPIYDNSNIDGLQRNITIPTMTKVGENCFPILAIESNKIIFDISELSWRKLFSYINNRII